MSDADRLRRLRRVVIQRLEALEAERASLTSGGHTEKARGILRAFQEVALVLETIDEILDH